MHDWKSVLVGIDLDAAGKVRGGSARAIETARWIASKSGAELVLHHAVNEDDEDDPLPENVATVMDELAAGLQREGTPARSEVREGRPWMTLIEAALSGVHDAVVIGKNNRAERHPSLGNHAKNVLRKCPVPVWAVHADRSPAGAAVVAATDLSPVGKDVLALATQVAAATDAPLHVVNTYRMPMQLQLERSRDEKAYQVDVAELREAHLAKVADQLRDAREGLDTSNANGAQDVETEVHVGCTSPSNGILEAVERFEPGVLVLGTVSRTGIPGLVIGSTAERLLDRVECSLLAVKPEGFISPVSPAS